MIKRKNNMGPSTANKLSRILVGGIMVSMVLGACSRIARNNPNDPRSALYNPTPTPAPTPIHPYVLRWGSPGLGDGQFSAPLGVAVDASGNVYVADLNNHRIQKFDANGNFVLKWGRNGGDGSSGFGDGEFNKPYYIAASPSGQIYVSDSFNHRVQVFDSSGGYITKWGTNGVGPGQFNVSFGITVDSWGNVYVGDLGNYRIQKFDASGNFLWEYGSIGVLIKKFLIPKGLAVDENSNIFIVDSEINNTGNNRFQKWDSNGNFLGMFGRWGSAPGELNNPYGIAIRGSEVFISDTDNSRIQVFDREGSFLAQWGSLGIEFGKFDQPTGIAVSPDGFVYVADTNNNRIQKFGP